MIKYLHTQCSSIKSDFKDNISVCFKNNSFQRAVFYLFKSTKYESIWTQISIANVMLTSHNQ